MPKISPFLWFDTQAEEAAAFYVSLFPNSKITDVIRYGPDTPGPEGGVMTVAFELDGFKVTALNGGPQFAFSPAFSFVIDCKDQAEVDRYWDALAQGGEPVACGWIKDRYGFSWQVVPQALRRLLEDPDPGRAQRATQAMLKMTKLDVAALEAAADAAG